MRSASEATPRDASAVYVRARVRRGCAGLPRAAGLAATTRLTRAHENGRALVVVIWGALARPMLGACATPARRARA